MIYKKVLLFCPLLALLIILILTSPWLSQATVDNSYLAYSLKEAKHRLTSGEVGNRKLLEMAGLTHLAGVIYDEQNDDLIIVGQALPGYSPCRLDDLVVAMRSVLDLHEYPLVSIDRTENSHQTGKMAVRFQGGIKATRFGRDLLAADIALKRLSLGLLKPKSCAVPSYLSMSLAEAKQLFNGQDASTGFVQSYDVEYFSSLSRTELHEKLMGKVETVPGFEQAMISNGEEFDDFTRIGSRFWLYPQNPLLISRDGACTIQDLDVICLTEVIYAIVNGKQVSDLNSVNDEIGDKFAGAVTANFGKLYKEMPVIGRVKDLFDLVALARGIELLPAKPDLSYWLESYQLEASTTDRDFGIITGIGKVSADNNNIRFLDISGGIELNPLTIRLQAGDVSAFKQAAVTARPDSEHALFWEVPLQGWQIPGVGKYYELPQVKLNPQCDKKGFSIDMKIMELGNSNRQTEQMVCGSYQAPRVKMPAFDGGGVSIDPVITNSDVPVKGLWQTMLLERPSENSLFWDF